MCSKLAMIDGNPYLPIAFYVPTRPAGKESAPSLPLPMPNDVIFNGPATIVLWNDGTKTVVKCQPGDTFSYEVGLMAAMLKRYMGNDNTYNKVLNKWLPAEARQTGTITWTF